MNLVLKRSSIGVGFSAIVMAIYGLNLDQFIGESMGIPPYIAWLTVFFMCFPVLLAVSGFSNLINSPLTIWLVFYNGICLLALANSPNATMAYDGSVMLLSTNLILLPAILASRYVNQLPIWIPIALFVLACSSIILDYFMPFRDLGWTSRGLIDRASGLYLNPNAAGTLVPLLLLLVFFRNINSFRLIFIALAGFAVLLSFSRSGMLSLALALLAIRFSGHLPRRYSAYLLLAVAAIIITSSTSDAIKDLLDIQSANALNRFDLIFGRGDVAAVADDDRVYLFFSGLKDVWEHPLIGQGLGFSNYWGEINTVGQSTHNMFLRNMLDFGIAGVLVWLGFCFALYAQSIRHGGGKFAIFLACYALLSGIFSHNLSESGWFLVLMALLAGLTTKSGFVLQANVVKK